MLFAGLALALQVSATALSGTPQRPTAAADSARDLGRARHAQASFERSRRALLPRGESGSGRCDVRLGRFCWWYDESPPSFPPESPTLQRRRDELLAQLDELAARYPGDDWLAATRVHYRVDARDTVTAESVASSCRATSWWCSALAGYAAHAGGNDTRADSAFSVAVASMPPDVACAWNDITPLLGGADREAYESRSCADRRVAAERYWMLSQPRLGTAANDWRNEFHARRVLLWLGERAATPHLLAWGKDAAELVLRYGWPVAWSRHETSSVGATEPSIIGHDPSPSFAFAPAGWLADSMPALRPEAWDLKAPRSEARFAPRRVRRSAAVAVQFARFRRGDSTLVVAAFAATDDSLLHPVAVLAAASDSALVAAAPDTSRSGFARVAVRGIPWMVGVDVADTTTRTLARTRITHAARVDSSRVTLSDILFHRGGEVPVTSLDSALAVAIRGDTATRNRALGLFWETYGLAAAGEPVDVAVSVERVDRSWIRSARQKLGLTPVDTPIRIRWTDAGGGADRGVGRAISLDLANLDAGRYRVTLTLTPEGEKAASATREVELLDP